MPIGINKKHFTKEERNARTKAESQLNGGIGRVKPPRWLDKAASAEFRRLSKELLGLKIVCNSDVGGLAIACDAYSKYIMATQAINAVSINAEITSTSGSSRIRKSPLGAVEKYATIYRQYCAEYGLTPAARIKLTSQYRAQDDEQEGGIAAFLRERNGGGA